MADSNNAGPGQGTSGKGIFSTPFGNAVTGDNPIGSDGLPKPYNWGNACDGFDTPKYSEGGMGVVSGPGTATGSGK